MGKGRRILGKGSAREYFSAVGSRSIIGITMGDPAGIGPEIIVKALADPRVYGVCKPVVFGDAGALSNCSNGRLVIKAISQPSEADGKVGQIDLIDICHLGQEALSPGIPHIEGGGAMVDCIITAVEMAKSGEIAAVVTCPISKSLMHKAGYAYEGHTQLIASLTQCLDYVMMLAGDRLRVALVTIHCPLKQVPSLLTKEKVYMTIAVTSKALALDFGIEKPRLAVAALNPHAGEAGLFGEEEDQIIIPAVEKARIDGYLAAGPYPADTLFYKAINGEFDAVVAMYHDQGLIPLKLLHFSSAVNVTLGLPIIRTSVDHGTAYDIAGKGIADPSSLRAAIQTAVSMTKNRARATVRA